MKLYVMHLLQLDNAVPATSLQQSAAVGDQQSSANLACIVYVASEIV